MQGLNAVSRRTTRTALERNFLISAGQSSNQDPRDSDEQEDGSRVCVTVLITMPEQPQSGGPAPAKRIVMGTALVDT